MKNKLTLNNNSDDVLKKKNTGANKTISTTVSNSTKENSSNGKNKNLKLLDQDEKIPNTQVVLIEQINDDVTNGIKNNTENENESEFVKLSPNKDELDAARGDAENILNRLTIDVNLGEKESLISTNRAREDSITTELKETMQSPPNTDNELGKFFTEEERLHAVDDTNKNVKERLERGIQHRNMGNSYFKKNKFKDSLNEYLSAVEEINGLLLLKTQSSLNVANIDWLRLECINNISVCYLLLKEYNKVIYYTEQVLAVNPNNVNSLSYRAKALIALHLYKEASECIKKALSIKYSKRLMTLLKEIEENINFGGKDLLDFEKDADEQNLIEFKKSSLFMKQEVDPKIGLVSTSSQGSESDVKKSEIKKPSTRSFLFSFLFTIIKFSKILSIGLIEFLKRHKYGILILIVIWIITFRTSFKNKMLNLILRIRFN